MLCNFNREHTVTSGYGDKKWYNHINRVLLRKSNDLYRIETLVCFLITTVHEFVNKNDFKYTTRRKEIYQHLI